MKVFHIKVQRSLPEMLVLFIKLKVLEFIASEIIREAEHIELEVR